MSFCQPGRHSPDLTKPSKPIVPRSLSPTATSKTRGEKTEDAAVDWLHARGDRVLLRRFKTPFAEVDILAMNPEGRILVFEVKSSFWPDDRALGLGHLQRQRLARAAFWIAAETGREVEVSLLGLVSISQSTQRGHFLEVPIF